MGCRQMENGPRVTKAPRAEPAKQTALHQRKLAPATKLSQASELRANWSHEPHVTVGVETSANASAIAAGASPKIGRIRGQKPTTSGIPAIPKIPNAADGWSRNRGLEAKS